MLEPYEAFVNSSMQCESLVLYSYSKNSLSTYTVMLWRCSKLAVCAHCVLQVNTLYANSTILTNYYCVWHRYYERIRVYSTMQPVCHA